MASLMKQFFSQCARPEGFMGRMMLRFMNFGHAPLTNWGLSHVDFKDQYTMLDIGCGGGATIQRLLRRSKGSQVFGIDISEESIEKARSVNAKELDSQVFLTVGSADSLPYDDNMFDVVTAVETVYFWPGLEHCLQEVKRVMKPGATFAIMLEVIETDSKWINVVEGMTVYSPEQLQGMLENAGFIHTAIYRRKPTYATIIGMKK